ncbi:Histone H1 [Zea mays]|uniref:Histone H1 n=1 Tax=Zea mays TaxID=4577 RepID=A0A1D6GFH2_MAIZE|nr:Histone H1 [Zea mays]
MATDVAETPAPLVDAAPEAPADTPAAPAVDAKPAKAKKATAPKKRASPTHPPYAEMVSEAIASLKERTGSSSFAIAKFLEDKHKDKLPPNFRKLLNVQLKKLVAGGKLTKVKNSYKLSSATKPKAAPKKTKTGVKKPKAAAKPKAKSPAKPKPATKPRGRREEGAGSQEGRSGEEGGCPCPKSAVSEGEEVEEG